LIKEKGKEIGVNEGRKGGREEKGGERRRGRKVESGRENERDLLYYL